MRRCVWHLQERRSAAQHREAAGDAARRGRRQPLGPWPPRPSRTHPRCSARQRIPGVKKLWNRKMRAAEWRKQQHSLVSAQGERASHTALPRTPCHMTRRSASPSLPLQ